MYKRFVPKISRIKLGQVPTVWKITVEAKQFRGTWKK